MTNINKINLESDYIFSKHLDCFKCIFLSSIWPTWIPEISQWVFNSKTENTLPSNLVFIIPKISLNVNLNVWINCRFFALACTLSCTMYKTNILKLHKFPVFPKISIWLILAYEIPTVAKCCIETFFTL